MASQVEFHGSLLHSGPNTHHIAGLDGLRALSVLMVLLYHSHLHFMKGGYLGVEIFFVISGFLITSILLNEATSSSGRIDLIRFWKRRFLRLFPALFALLFLITLISGLFFKEGATQYRADILASLLYCENWYQIVSGMSYFADQGYPLLRHIWSLAVEEQFYLLWPLLLAGVLRLSKGERKPLVLLTVVISLCSFTAMLALSHPHDPSSLRAMESQNRVYLGSDTRAFGILTGGLLAMSNWKNPLEGRGAAALSALALVSLGGLIAVSALLGTQDTFLYRGGFLLVDALTVAVIAGLVKVKQGPVRSLLATGWLEAIGRRSYGIYLWHWPIFRLLGPGQYDGGWIALRITATFLVAEVSYRWLETPIRQGRWRGFFLAATERPGEVLGGLLVMLCLAFMLGSGLLLAQQAPYKDEVMASLAANESAVARDLSSLQIASSKGHGDTARPQGRESGRCGGDKGEVFEPGITVTAVGDSVMKGAAVALKRTCEGRLGGGKVLINAEECRPFEKVFQILSRYKKDDRLGEVVVIHLGTNNSDISRKVFKKLAELLSDRRLVIFLTVKSDKSEACHTVNAALTNLVGEMPNARVFDWNAAAKDHGEFFYPDRTHLRAKGATFYASCILTEIERGVSQLVHGRPLHWPISRDSSLDARDTKQPVAPAGFAPR